MIIPHFDFFKIASVCKKGFCVAYTNCKPCNAMAEDIYSCISHGEQSGCHVVYCRRREAPVYARLSYVSFQALEILWV